MFKIIENICIKANLYIWKLTPAELKKIATTLNAFMKWKNYSVIVWSWNNTSGEFILTVTQNLVDGMSCTFLYTH